MLFIWQILYISVKIVLTDPSKKNKKQIVRHSSVKLNLDPKGGDGGDGWSYGRKLNCGRRRNW